MSVVGYDTPVVPRLDDIERLLATLLTRQVRVDRLAKGVTLSSPDRVAVYEDRTGALRAIIVVDRPLAAGLGGALAMIPPPAVVEDVESSPSLPDHLRENLYEVLNVCASLFNEARERALHLRLVGETSMTEATPAVRNLLDGGTGRVDCRVTVPGYPSGELAVRVQ